MAISLITKSFADSYGSTAAAQGSVQTSSPNSSSTGAGLNSASSMAMSSVTGSLAVTGSQQPTASSESAATSSQPTYGAPSSVGSSSASQIPQAVLSILDRQGDSLTQTAWNALTQDLKLGNLKAAQTDLSNYEQYLSDFDSALDLTNPAASPSATAGNQTLTSATQPINEYQTWMTPTTKFLGDLTQFAKDLQAGDLNASRSDLHTTWYDAPMTSDQALYWAEGAADQNAWDYVYAVEHGQLVGSAGPVTKADPNIAGIDLALRGENIGIEQVLESNGYSKFFSTQYASEITGMDNSQPAAQMDLDRTQQWMNALNSYAQGGKLPDGFSDLQAPTSASKDLKPVFDILASVIYATAIDQGREMQKLIEYTMDPDASNPNGAGAGASALNLIA